MIMQIDLPAGELPAVVFGAGPVTLDEVVALAARRARPVLSGDPAFARRIEAGAALLARVLGDEDAGAAPRELFTWHGDGLGVPFTPEQTRAILAVRLASLCRGQSGAGMAQLRLLCDLLEHDVLPEAAYEGPDSAAMAGLACLAAARADSLCRLASRIAALAAVALDESTRQFDEVLFAAKPYPGMARAAGWIRADLGGRAGTAHDAGSRNGQRLRDHDAIRRAPHVIGVLMDALPWMVRHIELELNSAGGELLVDVEGGRLLHGGHDHGGHMAYAMDGMKNAVGKLAKLFEHQMALLADASHGGLLSSLRSPGGARAAVDHGLKALQHNVSAWTVEAHKLAPEPVFHKADIGTSAARDCLRVIELTEQVAAALLVAVRHACALRYPDGLPPQLGAGLLDCMERIAELVPFTGGHRRLDHDLRRLLAVIRYDGATLLCRGAAEATARG